MCGIAGIIHNNEINYQLSIELMNKAQFHRGPDDNGVKQYKNAAIGHTRLSIVDISMGRQPMTSKNKNVCITFNGEIYGFLEIKKKLKYDFITNSDTEVLIALYQQYGTKMFSKLNGMFAFGIWDNDKKSLILARDRFGEKPLYYAFGKNGELIFASEIKAILASNLIKPKFSKKSLTNYFKYLYIDPLETIYENIYTLAPSSFITYRDGKIEENRYFYYSTSQQISIDDASVIFKSKFEKAVENQLVADVNVGAFLSGGLDSSSIVSVAKKYKKNLKTFSFGFEGSKSELSYAREIASKYNTDHYELFSNELDIADMLVKMADVYDEPFADSSNIPTYLISKLARDHSKVILSGDGADELLGGYSWWYDPLLGVGRKSNYFQEVLFKILGKTLFESYRYKSTRLKYSRKYSSVLEAHNNRPLLFDDFEIENLLGNKNLKLKSYSFKEENNINDALKADLEDYLAGDILVKTDRASMANSLELRSPFLDNDFASFCISLPSNLKVTSEQDKFILRKSYENYWTSNIRSRKKQGFGAPVNKWLLNKNVIELKNEYFRKNNAIFSFLSFEEARKYFLKDNYQTWALLVLSIWCEKNLGNVE
jgi:asparagine synthase (glutamine-hydrolysing)